ncbi:S8 family peptidase [Methylosinus sp. C49]|uniref:S8 family peptidase n=1 Tax=Methylosinus sp. C49 TaxID=2699395 RepID=UPI001379DC6D|nr:S8 family peptidase [Methylosinus sp. C49]
MAKTIYPHLLLDLKAYSIPFTPIGGGPKPPKPPTVPMRARHAARLRDSIERALDAKGENLKNLGVKSPERHGLQLTAKSRSKIGLRIDPIQKSGGPIELLSLRDEGQRQRGIVYLPEEKLDTVFKRLERYGSYAKGKPNNGSRPPDGFWFFESAADLTATSVEDLWFGDPETRPRAGEEAEWEIWIRPDSTQIIRSFARNLQLRCSFGQIDFPGVSIMRIHSTSDSIERLALVTGAILELRPCSSLVLEVLNLNNSTAFKLSNKVKEGIEPPADDAPRICILDSGVHDAHPLLAPALPPERCRTLNDAWGADGWCSHGTNVAGIALYPNLKAVLAGGTVGRLPVALESVTVLRPRSGPKYSTEAAGVVASAVAMVEAAEEAKRRVFCLAAADYDCSADGAPTSFSASVDQLAWGQNASPRLFCVAAGNVLDDPLKASGYPTRNEQSGIPSPGQALNALTIGGCTFVSEHPHGGGLLVKHGDLAPTARTSLSWSQKRSSIKPDVVYEAGNCGITPGSDDVESLPELGVLTTHKGSGLFGTLMETSAATAAVSGMAGRLMAANPNLWPETIRGLIVHSTDWTDSMLARVAHLENQERIETLLAMFGWGVPDEKNANRSASDHLTMIIQDEMAPLTVRSGEIRTNNLSYYELPWPVAALADLGKVDVELRVTLSYFIEPDVRAGSMQNLRKYPSHRFGFDLKGPDDTHIDAVRRSNRAFSSAGQPPVPTRTERGWQLGSKLRQRGSIHHDRWCGQARELARQGGIRVFPKGGWWADQQNLNYADVSARFSLIISIQTPENTVDIYSQTRSAAIKLARTRNESLTALERIETTSPVVSKSRR